MWGGQWQVMLRGVLLLYAPVLPWLRHERNDYLVADFTRPNKNMGASFEPDEAGDVRRPTENSPILCLIVCLLPVHTS